MLAVRDQFVAKSPEGLRSQSSVSESSALKDGSLIQDLSSSLHPNSVTINLGLPSFIAYSSHKQNPLLAQLFSAVDDIFGLFHGHIENIAPLKQPMKHSKQKYGLTKTADEVSIIIAVYRTLRDRGPYPAVHVVRNIKGKFAFILYDSSSKSIFIAADADASVSFFWGTDSEQRLVLSDDEEVVRKGCGKSLAPFPKGCFITSSGGLKNFESPLKKLKPIPWVDSSSQVCGATFIVEEEPMKETGMPTVASAA